MVGDLLRLVRLYYALPFSAGFLVILAYVRGGELESIRREAMLSFFSLLCVISAGYVFNDVCDVRIDRINCPDRVLAAGRLSRKTAMAWAGFLFVVGMLAAGLCGLCFFLGTGAMAAGLACYDLFSKRIGIFKDLLVAALLTSLYPLAFTLAQPVDTPRLKVLFIHPVWLVLSAGGYEMLKDIGDVKGDHRAHGRGKSSSGRLARWRRHLLRLFLRSTEPETGTGFRQTDLGFRETWHFLATARLLIVAGSLITLLPYLLGYCHLIYLVASLGAILLAVTSTFKRPADAVRYVYVEVLLVTVGSLADLLVSGP